MRISDLVVIRRYVEETCAMNHVQAPSVIVDECKASFKIESRVGMPDNDTIERIVDCVAQEMGRKGWHVDVFADGRRITVAFKDDVS